MTLLGQASWPPPWQGTHRAGVEPCSSLLPSPAASSHPFSWIGTGPFGTPVPCSLAWRGAGGPG